MKNSTIELENNVISVIRKNGELNRICKDVFAKTHMFMQYEHKEYRNSVECIQEALNGQEDAFTVTLHKKGYVLLNFYFDQRCYGGGYAKRIHKVSIKEFFRYFRLSTMEYISIEEYMA